GRGTRRRRTMLVRTLILTERRCTECRLSGEEVDFLLTGHANHLRIVPTRRRSHFRLTPTRYIGVIAAPGCRLVIRPKVPLRALFHLLDPHSDLNRDSESSTAEPGIEALHFLARRLVVLLSERVTAGLHRSYAEQPNAGPFL